MVPDGVVPAVLADALTASVADELAAVFTDQVVFPRSVVIDDPSDERRSFPGWPSPVLVISHENQGVVSWGVPLGDPSPPVLVGGDVATPEAEYSGTTVYAPGIEAFIAARRWDATCLDRQPPLVQAQADVLDDESLAVLRAEFDETLITRGWPGHTQYRFEGRGVKLLLWSASGQCDWWLSGTETDTLAAVVADLMDLSNLREAFWSNDLAGIALLREIRGGG